MWSELKKHVTLPAELQKQADSCSQGEIRDALSGLGLHTPEVVVTYVSLQYIETVIIHDCFRRVTCFEIPVHYRKHCEAWNITIMFKNTTLNLLKFR